MSFIPGNTGTPSTAVDGIVGKGQLSNVETISSTRGLTNADRRIQILTPSGADRIVTLPSASIVAGESWTIMCASGSAYALNIQASNGDAVATLIAGEALQFAALIAVPSAAANWSTFAPALVLADGSVTAPSLRFTGGGANTGLYAPATDVIGVSIDGAEKARFTSSGLNMPGLTASQAVFTNASKELVSNAITGTGSVVMSTSPTLVTPTLGAAAATSLKPTTDATFNFYLYNGSTSAASYTTAGAWTLGPASQTSATQHILQGQKNATYRHVLSIDDRTEMTTGVGGGIVFRGDATDAAGASMYEAAGIEAYKENATTANYASSLKFFTTNAVGTYGEKGKVDSAGAWTLGPASAGANFNGQKHYVSGGLWASNVTSTAGSGWFPIGTNCYIDANTADTGRTETTKGGIAIVLANQSAATDECFRIYSNAPGAAVDAAATLCTYMSHHGAWVWGDLTATTTGHTINCTRSSGFALTINNASGDANAAGLTIRCGDGDSTQIIFVARDYADNTKFKVTGTTVQSEVPIQMFDGTAAAPSLCFSSSGNTNTGLYLKATDSLGFSANGTEIGSYSSAGAWTLGTTGVTTSQNWYSGAADYHTVFTNANAATPYGLRILFSAAHPDDNTSSFLICSDDVTTRCIIYSDGDLQNADNSYGGISDIRLKQDIIDSTSQLDDICNLRVRKYRFISDVESYGDEAKYHIGLIAQETQEICPGLVQYDSDRDVYSIQYSVLYMKAIKALQELTAESRSEIATLKSRIAELEKA